MKLAKLMSIAWICLAMHTPEQDKILNQKISLHYEQTTIEIVLRDIQQQYGIRFSYLNNELPEDLRVDIAMDEQPLYLALDEMLKETSLSYQVVSGQVILKRDLQKAKSQEVLPGAVDKKPVATSNSPTAVRSPDETEQESRPTKSPAEEEQEVQLATASIGKGPVLVRPLARQELPPALPEQYEEIMHEAQPEPAARNGRPYIPTDKPQRRQNQFRDKVQDGTRRIGVGLQNLFQKLPDEADYEKKTVHLGIIYPFSTNGVEAGKYVNELSFHWLVGYAAGLDGVEFSGFGNIENDFVNGVQGAGFFNLVRNEVEGVQLAGFVNLNGGDLGGVQFSGFLNAAVGDIDGIQGSGFLNMAAGYTKGAQLTGFMNIVADDANALQASGFANITAGNMKGAQLSGFLNYSGDVNVQASGFANIATGDVNGLQASGFINVARNVNGVQLGVFNLADSVSGVPIGFLSIVRKNGFRQLEVWGGETLQANAAFKIGVEKFYNIFAFGSQFASQDFRWGFGYGAGTQIGLSDSDFLNLELISYQIREGDDQWVIDDLNLLNTLRLAYSHQFSEHFGLFVAPTFNVMVSNRQQNNDGSIGSDIAPWTIYDETYDNRTNVQMWPGFHAGIRF